MPNFGIPLSEIKRKFVLSVHSNPFTSRSPRPRLHPISISLKKALEPQAICLIIGLMRTPTGSVISAKV